MLCKEGVPRVSATQPDVARVLCLCGKPAQASGWCGSDCSWIGQQVRAEVHAQQQQKTERFYIIDTRMIVGNCALFWCPNGNGYTTQLEEAGLYSEEDANNNRDTDVAVPESMAKTCAVTHVRLDRLREMPGFVWPRSR